MTEITQADRDAAASGYFAWCSGNPVIPDRMKAGNADDHSMVQAFARHRMEATEALSAENERPIKAGDGDVGLIHWQGERIEQLEAALAKSEALQDLAYYNGAKQYAAISAQSEDAARDWLAGGCGNRQRDAIAALGDTK